jgi:hypothetical protein
MKFSFLISTLFLFLNISAQTPLLKKGEKAPDFDAVEISTKTDKKLSSINSDYCLIVFYMKGQDIIGFKSIYAEYKSKGLEIYAVCFCDNCEPELKQLEEQKIEWPTVRPWGKSYMKGGNIDRYVRLNLTSSVMRPVSYLLDKNKIALTDRLEGKNLALELKKVIK